MTYAARVARNTIIQVVGKFAGTLLGFAVVAILTRALGQGGYGQYTTVFAYLGFFSVVADLGLYLVAVRELNQSREEPGKIIGNILGLRAVSAAFLLGLGVAIAAFFPYPPAVRQAIALGSLAFFFVAFNQIFVGVFQTHLVMHRLVAGELVGRILLLGGVLVVAHSGAGLLAIVGSVVLGSFANLLVTFAFARQLVPIRFRFDFQYWRRILIITLPLAISVILNLIYFRIDTIFLSLFRPAETVGLYGASYKVLEILVTFPNMFVGLILPALSASAFVDPERFRIVFQRSFDLLVLSALPILVGGWFVAEPLMRLIGGDAFTPAAPYFRLLLVAVVFLYFGSLSGHTIVAIHKQRQMVWGYLSVALLGVALYLILIPPFGAVGAAIGTIATEGTIMLIGYAMVLRTMRFPIGLGAAGKAILGSAALVISQLVLMGSPLLVRILVGIAVYAAALFLLRAVPPALLRELVSLRSQPEEPPAIGPQP